MTSISLQLPTAGNVPPGLDRESADLPLVIRHLDGIDRLRDEAKAWDDLWQRSSAAAPTLQAELIAQWVERFAGKGRFRGLAVQQGERLVAALPLIGKRLGRILEVGGFPSNDWSVSGDLLLDESGDAESILDALANAVHELNWPLLWLDQAPFEESRWVTFRLALERAGMQPLVREQFQIGQVEIAGDWKAYESTRDGDHRRSRQRYSRMLEKAGRTALQVYRSGDLDEVDSLMRRGFEIEDRSWKSAAGTSVLRTPGMFEFYRDQACLLSQRGQLELVFLEHNGEPIAFVYGWRSKGVHFVCKLGYDDAYRKFGPGQQMLMRLLERFHSEPGVELLDFWGPLVSWNQSWSTRHYPVGRVMVPVAPLTGGLALHAYKSWLPRWRSLRGYVKTSAGKAAPDQDAKAADGKQSAEGSSSS